MKPNFVLSPDNVGTFVKRFNRIMNISGLLKIQAEYTGMKRLATLCERSGIKNVFIIPTYKTDVTYADIKVSELDIMTTNWGSDTVGAGLSLNDAYFHPFEWGDKFRFTTNRVYHFDKGSLFLTGSIWCFEPYWDQEKVWRWNRKVERDAEDYIEMFG